MNALYANVAYDPAVWFAIPIYWGPETWESPRAWAAETAQYRWRRGRKARPKAKDVERTEAGLAYLAEAYGFRDPDGPEVVAYLHLPHPAMTPLPVKVWVEEGGEFGLADLKVSDDPNVVEPATVDDFATEYLGRGIRVLRYLEADLSHDESGELSLYAVLHYAFEIPEENAVIVACTTCPDLARLVQAADDIDDFVREIRWAYEPQALVGSRKGT